MIGYYVHHQGLGHRARALTIARHLDSRVTGLSSLEPPDGWPGDWVTLPLDDAPPLAGQDHTASGALHWAPPHHRGLRDRMARIARWIQQARPRLIVVDVSVEVAVFVRLMGIPTVVVALPGERSDDAHRLAYRVADAVLAPWPRWAAPMRTAEPTQTLQPIGGLSRFDWRTPDATRHEDTRRRVLLLTGKGGHDLTDEQLASAAASTPDWDWRTPGLAGQPWVADPWPELCAADVVVSHAGIGAIGEVAAARAPSIVIPQDRPHREQHHTARVLANEDLATVSERWPDGDDWPALLDAAARRDGRRWERWSDRAGGPRAAARLEQLARSGP